MPRHLNRTARPPDPRALNVWMTFADNRRSTPRSSIQYFRTASLKAPATFAPNDTRVVGEGPPSPGEPGTCRMWSARRHAISSTISSSDANPATTSADGLRADPRARPCPPFHSRGSPGTSQGQANPWAPVPAACGGPLTGEEIGAINVAASPPHLMPACPPRLLQAALITAAGPMIAFSTDTSRYRDESHTPQSVDTNKWRCCHALGPMLPFARLMEQGEAEAQGESAEWKSNEAATR